MLDGRWLYVAAIPVAVAIVALRAGRGRTLVALVALAHVAILANVALFPIPIEVAVVDPGRAGMSGPLAHGGLNLVPFATIGPVLAGRAAPIATQIAILNVLVLTPAGIYLPVLLPRLRSSRAAIPLTVVGGLSIEAAQLAVSAVLGIRYRWIDIDDVVLNAIGILIGWLIARAVLGADRFRLAPASGGPKPGGQDGRSRADGGGTVRP